MILQPLVENAIVHGVAAIPGPGEVHVSIHRDQDHLVIDVRDTGPGPGSTEGRQSGGIGLTNSRARLKQLYGDAASLSLLAPTGGGTIARLRLPWRRRNSRRNWRS